MEAGLRALLRTQLSAVPRRRETGRACTWEQSGRRLPRPASETRVRLQQTSSPQRGCGRPPKTGPRLRKERANGHLQGNGALDGPVTSHPRGRGQQAGTPAQVLRTHAGQHSRAKQRPSRKKSQVQASDTPRSSQGRTGGRADRVSLEEWEGQGRACTHQAAVFLPRAGDGGCAATGPPSRAQERQQSAPGRS